MAADASPLHDKAPPFPDGELSTGFELGAVDEQSVRVWIRDADKQEAEVELTVCGEQTVAVTVELSEDTDWTGAGVLRLPAPAPSAPFVCRYGSLERHGRLAPSPETHSDLVFAFGSCNRPFILDDNGAVVVHHAAALYPAMQQHLRETDASFLLLAGDQVYSDELDPISVRHALPGDEENPPPYDVTLDAYRHIYRGYLNQSGFRELRESVPTLCIWDDHDIFNNWGSRLEESQLDQQMFKAASESYVEYQHLRNPDAHDGLPPYHYSFRHGDIGFFVLDVRGKRNYQEGSILGKQQWEAFDGFLGSKQAESIRTLFVVSTIPMAHTARWVADLFAGRSWEIADSVRDRWSAPPFIEQRNQVLNRLFDWQTEAPHRQVVFLSGDVHVAGASTIYQRNGNGVIQQFISSAMTTLPEWVHNVIHRIVTKGMNLRERDYRFQYHFLRTENNYGLVRLTARPEGGHDIDLEIMGIDPNTQRVSRVAHWRCSPPDGVNGK